MKKLLAVLVMFAAGFALGTALIVWRGVGTHPEPGMIETRVARLLRHVSISESERARRNPIVVEKQTLIDARQHWADHCAVCHANDGSGDTEIGRNLYPRAPDMRLPETQKLTDGELFTIIRDGVRLTGMPGWGGSSEDNWKLVHFVRRLPNLTPEEIRAMERFNPMSAEEIERRKHEAEFLKGH